ncbi:molybdopterin converting factor subunit 1 [[Limnothrix rosea] IAM M-220]|uniref:molybdopterin converting factor subunit 1 n=1 Tax=[Limnothrix rosea] IAM M-220 TaxID=454133 RepID=UPI000A0575D5|nr:molybdopterin converting factor subunit 1 [[Limnothrix rosea] IAM M-220]
MINISVKLFAIYQETYQQDQLELQLEDQATVKTLADHIFSEHPELQEWRNVTRYGVNMAFVDENTVLKDGDEIVFIPPVSGG